MKNKIVVLLFGFLSICVFSAGLISQRSAVTQISGLTDDSIVILEHNNSGTKIELEVAASPAKRARGLMFIEDLKENHGMFFVFDSLENLSFWMKDTPLSLDIIFLDQDFRVVNFHKNTIPNQTETLYSSGNPARYVIELKAGWIARNSLSLSDQFTIR